MTKAGFRRSSYPFKVYHDNGEGNEGNQRYVQDSGELAGTEIVVDAEGNAVWDQPRNAASYNYANNKTNPAGHFFKDMLPYFLFGNSPNDPSNIVQRLGRGIQNPRRMLLKNGEAYWQ